MRPASASIGTFQIELAAKKDWHSSIDLTARRSVLLHMCVCFWLFMLTAKEVLTALVAVS